MRIKEDRLSKSRCGIYCARLPNGMRPILTVNVEGTSRGNDELFGQDKRARPPGARVAKKPKSESSSGTAGLRMRCKLSWFRGGSNLIVQVTVTGYPSVLQGYTDASWISNTEDNSSTSGSIFLLGGGVIFWASKKQTCITGSIMESKFVALAVAGKKVEWLKNLLLEIPLWSKPIATISIRCDSASTLTKAYSQMYNGKSRHLGVRHSMIRKLIKNEVVSIKFMRSQRNLADHLTKGLALHWF
ncbi:hypothetical protein Tco_0083595 [Tanacetum coccineum]